MTNSRPSCNPTKNTLLTTAISSLGIASMFWNGWPVEALYPAFHLVKAWCANLQARARFFSSHGTQQPLECIWLLMQGAKHENLMSKRMFFQKGFF